MIIYLAARNLVGSRLFSLSCSEEGNGNPLQCSCLENPRDGGALWAAVYGVAQSQTRLKRLSLYSLTTTTLQLIKKKISDTDTKASQRTQDVEIRPGLRTSPRNWKADSVKGSVPLISFSSSFFSADWLLIRSLVFFQCLFSHLLSVISIRD